MGYKKIRLICQYAGKSGGEDRSNPRTNAFLECGTRDSEFKDGVPTQPSLTL